MLVGCALNLSTILHKWKWVVPSYLPCLLWNLWKLDPSHFKLPFAHIEKRVGRFSQFYFISSSFMIAKCPPQILVEKAFLHKFFVLFSPFLFVCLVFHYIGNQIFTFFWLHMHLIITITPHATSIFTCYENFLMVLMDLMKDKNWAP